MMSMRGMLITVEGVEGSGKSTQCRRLAESLRARGLDVILTREPDGTPMGAAIRRLFTADAPTPTPLTQVFLFMAARQQHVAAVVRPALSRGALGADRVAHAYAFVGPPGVGRKLTALAFAKALVAPAGGGPAARIERGAHPDVRLIQPTPPEDNPKGPLLLRIENVRALERLAALRPAEAARKVFIVDEADRMTAATPQAFLKT